MYKIVNASLFTGLCCGDMPDLSVGLRPSSHQLISYLYRGVVASIKGGVGGVRLLLIILKRTVPPPSSISVGFSYSLTMPTKTKMVLVCV